MPKLLLLDKPCHIQTANIFQLPPRRAEAFVAQASWYQPSAWAPVGAEMASRGSALLFVAPNVRCTINVKPEVKWKSGWEIGANSWLTVLFQLGLCSCMMQYDAVVFFFFFGNLVLESAPVCQLGRDHQQHPTWFLQRLLLLRTCKEEQMCADRMLYLICM